MITVDSLTRTYGDFTAVDNVSFKIERGEIVGLLGHNGAGKTTIMKMITGFLEPTAGKIDIDGLDIGGFRGAVQGKIGYLPENCPVYPEMTVIDYLDYAAALHAVPEEERNERVREAIARTELESKASAPIQTLSRGYQQRVGVAQAILHSPSILILDEPTNGLDPTQIQQMRTLIKDLAKNATVILSTHILQEVQAVCDRVLIIHEGRLALDSRLDELRAGSRLLVDTDAERQRAEEVLSAIGTVSAVEPLADGDERSRFALVLDRHEDPAGIGPAVARAAVEGGMNLYSMFPEARDLESVFSEISARNGRAAS